MLHSNAQTREQLRLLEENIDNHTARSRSKPALRWGLRDIQRTCYRIHDTKNLFDNLSARGRTVDAGIVSKTRAALAKLRMFEEISTIVGLIASKQKTKALLVQCQRTRENQQAATATTTTTTNDDNRSSRLAVQTSQLVYTPRRWKRVNLAREMKRRSVTGWGCALEFSCGRSPNAPWRLKIRKRIVEALLYHAWHGLPDAPKTKPPAPSASHRKRLPAWLLPAHVIR